MAKVDTKSSISPVTAIIVIVVVVVLAIVVLMKTTSTGPKAVTNVPEEGGRQGARQRMATPEAGGTTAPAGQPAPAPAGN